MEVERRFQAHSFFFFKKKLKHKRSLFHISQHCSKVEFKQGRVLTPEIQHSSEEFEVSRVIGYIVVLGQTE